MIKVRSKTLLIPEEEASIGSVGEGNSTVREFQIDRISGDGVDLANLIFRLNFRHELASRNQSDRSDLEKIITDKAIILRWTIDNHVMRYSGTLFIQIDAFDEGGVCRWKSYQGVVYVEESIERVEVSKTTLSELEQLEKKFSKFKVSSDALSNIEETNKKITAAIEEVKANKEAVVQAKSGVDEAKKSVDLAKVAVESAESSVNSAKASIEAIKAENEATRQDIISKHGEVKTFADEVKSANREVKSLSDGVRNEIRLAADEKQELSTKIAEVGRTAIGVQALSESAKTASQNASASADRASASEGKAKESETKVLEALKKAEGMGGGGGASMVDVKNFINYRVVDAIKSLDALKKDLSGSDVEGIVSAIKENGSDAVIKKNDFNGRNVISAGGTIRITENILNEIGQLKSKNIKKYKDLAEYFGYPYNPGGALYRIKNEFLKYDWYGGINIGDYIEIGQMKFFVAGIDCQFYIDDDNTIRTDFKHVDFVCLNTELHLYIPDEEIGKYKNVNVQGSFCNMNNILQERVLPNLSETFPAYILDKISPKYIGRDSAREREYGKIWIPTEEELVGTDCLGLNSETLTYIHQRQYPLFIQHPRLCVDGNGYITANTKGNYMSIIKYGVAEKMEYTNSERFGLQIPIGFRVQSEK